jgi:hypothetical protein
MHGGKEVFESKATGLSIVFLGFFIGYVMAFFLIIR